MGWRGVGQIDWAQWRPRHVSSLVFIFDGGRVLLIRKKRGLGAGKINGPGGKLEAGETPEQCAAREVREEVGLRVGALHRCGVLRFQFQDGYAILVYVFRSNSHTGRAVETAEAAPFWTDCQRIPYGEMWQDDRHWLPLLLAGIPFDGCFLFDGDRMVDFELSQGAAAAAAGGAAGGCDT